MDTYWCEMAWVGGAVAEGVQVHVEGDRVTEVKQGVPPSGEILQRPDHPGHGQRPLHAFHRALRGHTQVGRGSFWTWREQMYAVAGRLDPDTYYQLARAAYAEMALAGITAVGEFHYLHHDVVGRSVHGPQRDGPRPGPGRPRRRSAARPARHLLPVRRLRRLPWRVQTRFGDGDVHQWAERADRLAAAYAGAEDVEIGAAIHSVRAMRPEQMPVVVEFTHHHAGPLHVHVSEQPAENERCVAAYAASPVRVLHEAGVLGPRSTAVHATHVSDEDVALLGGSGTHVCVCPTTERDLADGVCATRRLHLAGSPITLGSDSHAVVDLFEEARAVELGERIVSGERGHWRADELLTAATVTGHTSLGFPDGGQIAPGAWADLVTVRLDSVRTAGATAGSAVESVVFAATGADVVSVVSGGRRIVDAGRHVTGEVGHLLRDAIGAVRG